MLRIKELDRIREGRVGVLKLKNSVNFFQLLDVFSLRNKGTFYKISHISVAIFQSKYDYEVEVSLRNQSQLRLIKMKLI